jgi:integrase
MNCAATLAGLENLSATQARRIRHHCNRWSRWTGDPPFSSVTSSVFDAFRRDCLEAGLSPWTIESTVWEVCHLAQLAGYALDPGRKLRRPPPQPRVPSLGTIGRLYLVADQATWPKRSWATCGDWWRCLLVVAVWTGWRRSDLARLAWADVEDDRLVIRAKKTGITHQIPMTPTVRRHLDLLAGHSGPVFAMTRSHKQLDDQFTRLASAAGVPPVTLQQIRRLAITNWSSVNAEAGRIVHGCGLGILRHYLDPLAVLQAAAPLVRLPEVFLSDEELDAETRHRQELLDCYARAGRTQRDLILGVAQSVSRIDTLRSSG